MKNLLTLNYWFNLQPEALQIPVQRIFIGFIILLAVLAIIIAIIKRRGGIYRGVLNRIYSFCLGNTVIGLIILFFNYEATPFFSARFWFGIWILIMIAWLFFILKKLMSVPARKKELEEEKELKKYLP